MMSALLIAKIAASLVLAAMLGAAATLFIRALRTRSPGEHDVLAPLLLFAYAALCFIAPGLLRIILAESNPFTKGSVFIGLICVAAVGVFGIMLFSEYFARMLARTVPLTFAKLPPAISGGFTGLTIAHLSDLHISDFVTLEGALKSEAVRDNCEAALRWALARADKVCITGDITDLGSAGEWQIVRQLMQSLSSEQRSNIYMIPGNHDLTLTRHSDPTRGGPRRLDFEQRCRAFAINVFADCPETWRVWRSTGCVSVREVLRRASGYLSDYDDNPPFEKHVGGGGNTYGAHILSNPEALLSSADRHASAIWPSRSSPLFMDLLEALYPMVFHEDEKYVIVGLNSANCASFSIMSGAFGHLGAAQIARLGEVIAYAGSRPVIVLMHHHLGWPTDLYQQLGITKHVEFKALQLVDAEKFDEKLNGRQRIVIMHGHKHIRYQGTRGGATIISGASVTYGDQLANGPNCAVYAIEVDGSVSVVEEGRLALEH